MTDEPEPSERRNGDTFSRLELLGERAESAALARRAEIARREQAWNAMAHAAAAVAHPMSATSSSRIDRHRIEHRAVPAFASPRRSTGATEGRHAGASPRSTLMDQLAERALELDLDDDARRLRMHAANTPQIGAPHTTPSPDIGNELARFSPTSTASEPPAAAAAQPGIESEPPAAPVHAAIEPNWSVRSATPEAPAAFHAAALESQLHGTSLAARDLAALVNDALLEQARRHGVDMS